MKWLLSTIAIYALIGCYSNFARAQDASDKTIDDYYIDFAVPDLPALAMLGFSSNEVARPGNLQELSVAFSSLAKDRSAIAPGIGIAWTPAQTFKPKSIEAYKRNIFRKFQLSFATVKNMNATDLGISFRFVAIDHSDPLFNSTINEFINDFSEIDSLSEVSAKKRKAFLDKVKIFILEIINNIALIPDSIKIDVWNESLDVWNIEEEPSPFTTKGQIARCESSLRKSLLKRKINANNFELRQSLPDSLLQQLNEYADDYIDSAIRATVFVEDLEKLATKKIKKVKEITKKQSWNATVVNLDFGFIFSSASSTFKGLRADRLGGALGGAFPVGHFGQWLVQVQGRKSINDSPVEDWFYSVGTRFLFSSSSSRFSIEGLLSNTEHIMPEKDGRSYRFTLGVEFKLFKGAWFEIATGGEFPQGEGASSNIISLGNIKYTFHEKSRFDIPD